MFNTFMVGRGARPPDASAVPQEVQELLGVLKVSNPLVKVVKTLAEKDVPGHGLPLLPPEAIASITAAAAARNPAYMGIDPDNDCMDEVFSLVSVIDADPQVISMGWASM